MKAKILDFDPNSTRKLFDKCLALFENNKEFCAIQNDYNNTIEKLRKIFSETDDIVVLYMRLILINMQMTYKCGIKDNLHHFKNPDAPTFMDHYDLSLHEEDVHRTEEFISTYAQINEILSTISPEADELHNETFEYLAALETCMPKLAHYYGYLSANTTLKETIPEYEEDTELTAQYTKWLSGYLDVEL